MDRSELKDAIDQCFSELKDAIDQCFSDYADQVSNLEESLSDKDSEISDKDDEIQKHVDLETTRGKEIGLIVNALPEILDLGQTAKLKNMLIQIAQSLESDTDVEDRGTIVPYDFTFADEPTIMNTYENN